jgi:hypothetical protein
MFLEAAIALLALLLALLCRPWRMLGSRAGPGGMHDPVLSPLITPLLAILVLLPWVWALPELHKMPLQLHWSGAPLVLLLIGWPLAVPVLIATSAIAFALAPALGLQDALGMAVWQGLVPATLAMLWGQQCAAGAGTTSLSLFSCAASWARLCACSSRPARPMGRACAAQCQRRALAWPAGSWPGAMA